MPNTVNGITYEEVAKLLYHCSVAVDMHYGPDGSGAQTSKLVYALKTFYFYSSNIQYVSKSNYSQTGWENLLKQQIDNKWPMAYQGMDGTEGHAWNCDGYNGNQFHMNWGWGGSGNGYYTLDNLVVSGYTFNSSQGAVINVYPASNYPEWCSGTKLITGRGGTFNDGSGNQNYQNNISCKYLIQPTCASSVSLSFDRFNLASGDNVLIYDGTDENSPLLATFNSSNLPSSTINSSGDALLVKFVTDAVNTDYGWYASYSTQTCSGSKTLTAPSGIVEDGSKSCNYDNSKICTWNIEPPNAVSFMLNFIEFDFPSGDVADNLKIYKNNTSSSNLIGTYTSANVPPSTLEITGASKLIIRFTSNASVTAGGFKFSYTTYTNIADNNADYNVRIYPNPIKSNTIIEYNLKEANNKVAIVVENILGQTIGSYTLTQPAGQYSINLNSVVEYEKMTKGIYFVRLIINNNESVHKLVY
jgi:hypothetical protein